MINRTPTSRDVGEIPCANPPGECPPERPDVPVMQAKQRTCLKCNRLFPSTGPGNRICSKCQRINARLPRYTEAQLQKQRGIKRHNGEIMEPVLDD